MIFRSSGMCLDFKLCDVLKMYWHFVEKLRKYEFDKGSLSNAKCHRELSDPFCMNN